MRPLGGGHVHFNLYRDQFASDCQTVWDGNLLECNKAVNFFIWPSDAWKLRFWPILKKVWQILDFWCITATLKKKSRKKWWKFFSFFLFLLCSVDCIMLPRLDIVLENYFSIPYEVSKDIKSDCKVDVKMCRNHPNLVKNIKSKTPIGIWFMMSSKDVILTS